MDILPELQQLMNKRRQSIRAHQILPRHRRRRQMSYNFHRLPQSLRPRALKETNSTELIFKQNAPSLSRKARRCHCKDRRHIFLAKRMHIVKVVQNMFSEVKPGVFKLTSMNHQKLLRFAMRSVRCVVDRSESMYSTLYSQNKTYQEGFQLINEIPVEIVNLQVGQLCLAYSFQVDSLLQHGFVLTDLKNCLVIGDLNGLLAELNVSNMRQQSVVPFELMGLTSKSEEIQRDKMSLVKQMQLDLQQDQLKKMNMLLQTRIKKHMQKQIFQDQKESQQANLNSQLVIFQHNNINSLFMPAEQLRGFYKLNQTVLGAKEKRFVCYQNQIVDLIEFLNIDQIESLIIEPAPKQWCQKKDFTKTPEFKKFLMSNKPLSEVKFPQTKSKDEEGQKLNINEFLEQKFQFGSGLYCDRLGKKIGLAKSGKVDVHGVVL